MREILLLYSLQTAFPIKIDMKNILSQNVCSELSLVIRQRGESQNGCFKKTKHVKFSEKRTFLCVSGGKKCSFFAKFGVLCFLETPVLRFALLPYYRRYHIRTTLCISSSKSDSQSELFNHKFKNLNSLSPNLLRSHFLPIPKKS